MTRRLQRIMILLVTTTFLPVLVHAETRKSDDALLKVRETVWRAWFAGNVKLLQQLVPPDTIVISAGDREWKSQSDVIRESAEFRASGAKLVRLDFPKTRIQHFGNVAIIWSEYVLETESGGKQSESSGRVTEIFVWRNGAWLNPGWHTDSEK